MKGPMGKAAALVKSAKANEMAQANNARREQAQQRMTGVKQAVQQARASGSPVGQAASTAGRQMRPLGTGKRQAPMPVKGRGLKAL